MADNKLYEVLGVNKNASDGEIKKVTMCYYRGKRSIKYGRFCKNRVARSLWNYAKQCWQNYYAGLLALCCTAKKYLERD